MLENHKTKRTGWFTWPYTKSFCLFHHSYNRVLLIQNVLQRYIDANKNLATTLLSKWYELVFWYLLYIYLYKFSKIADLFFKFWLKIEVLVKSRILGCVSTTLRRRKHKEQGLCSKYIDFQDSNFVFCFSFVFAFVS